MISVITSFSRMTMILFCSAFVIIDFFLLYPKLHRVVKSILTGLQFMFLTLFLANGTLVLYINTADIRLWFLFIGQFLFFSLSSYFLQTIVDPVSEPLLRNVYMLLSFSFIELERLDFDRAVRQFVFSIVALIFAVLLIVLLKRFKYTKDLYYAYFFLGVLLLLFVLVAGTKEYGAKLSVNLGFVSVQPSEFVKLSFAFFIASLYSQMKGFKAFAFATIGAGVHLMILAMSNDFGAAFIFLITYIALIFVATGNYFIFFGEVAASIFGAMMVYRLFPHVQTRFIAWADPLSVVDNQGYQISQSLFAIGTGGWLGSGIYQGSPNKIPVVAKDFIFSAISEEMGGIIAFELIFIVLFTIILVFISAINTKDRFYMLVSTGFGISFATQAFLNIGGVTNFIPSTGVTLPFVSYGGSSLLALFIGIAIVESGYDLGKLTKKKRKSNRVEVRNEG